MLVSFLINHFMNKLIRSLKQEPVVNLFTKYYLYLFEKKNLFWICTFLWIISSITAAAQPAVVAYFLNTIQQQGVSQGNLWTLIAIFSIIPLLSIVTQAIGGVANLLITETQLHVGTNYKRYLNKQLFARSISWIDAQKSGALADKINNASNALVNVGNFIDTVIRLIVSVTSALLAIYYFNGVLTLLVVIVSILVIYVVSLFDKKIVPINKRTNDIGNDYQASFYDGAVNATTVKTLNIQSTIVERLRSLYEKAFPLRRSYIKWEELKWLSVDILFVVGVLFLSIITYLYTSVSAGSIVLVGSITALYQYINRLEGNLYNFSYTYSQFRKYKSDNENAEEIEYFKDTQVERKAKKVNHNLSVRKLNFSYPETPALKNIVLTIDKGERIAMIGHSGSGKTTFLKVLHGMYEDATTMISIDGKKIDKQFHEIDLATTLVPQDPELFSSSVTENITFGLDYSDEQIRASTDLAEFTTVAEGLPHGFDSKINEKGVNLSGGQKQRLALARALLFAADKDIVLLDESTSSVDPETENRIYKNLFETYQDKTFIASIHKLNLLKHFDRIVMFEKGSIVADGTFTDLVKNNSKFSSLWEEYRKTNS